MRIYFGRGMWLLTADTGFQCISGFKDRSHGAATAPLSSGFHYNKWIRSYWCSNGNGTASKWVPTLFLRLQQWQTNCFNCYLLHQCEHFGPIAAEKPLPLPHRVNGLLRLIHIATATAQFSVILVLANGYYGNKWRCSHGNGNFIY